MANRNMPSQAYTVTQVNGYIKNMFAQDFLLVHIYVKGEVSNCKYHNSGHLYFSLKDEGGTLSCVMFAGQRKGLSFPLRDGQQVIVLGSVSIYERNGTYQLYAREILLEGEGQLYEQFARLKRELEEMGMFAREYKQPIPFYSRRIGVVTAPTGAAIQDIRNISRRRNPYVQLILYPSLVQGEGSAESIVEGIETLDRLGLDVIIVGRGGGSMEDLWAFNEVSVARAIFECRTPVISAVGHETDTTIIDFVSDLRAPTPSAAAELAVADIREILGEIEEYRVKLQRGIQRRLKDSRMTVKQMELQLKAFSPAGRIREKKMRLIGMEEQLQHRISKLLQEKRHEMELYIQRLKGLSPLEKLSSGYSYVSDMEGRNIRSVKQVEAGQQVTVRVSDGSFEASVRRKELFR